MSEINIDSLVSAYEAIKNNNDTPLMKASHGELNSSFCSAYCKKCISNGAIYRTMNSQLREFFMNIPFLNLYLFDNGFRLAQRALPNPVDILSDAEKDIKQIPLLRMAENIDEKVRKQFQQFRRK